MILEHIGLAVKKPIKTAEWYKKNLGCRIRFKKDREVVFVSDKKNDFMFEWFPPSESAPLPGIKKPLSLHFAFKSVNPDKDSEKLQKAGAKLISNCKNERGDMLILLKDPFGNSLQLVKRGKNIFK